MKTGRLIEVAYLDLLCLLFFVMESAELEFTPPPSVILRQSVLCSKPRDE